MVNYEYASLTFSRFIFDQVKFPDGDTRLVDPGKGNSFASKWLVERFRAEVLPALRAEKVAAKEDFERWRELVEIEWLFTKLPHPERFFAERVSMAIITFPATTLDGEPYEVVVEPEREDKRVVFRVTGGRVVDGREIRTSSEIPEKDLDRLIRDEYPRRKGLVDLPDHQEERAWLDGLPESEKPSVVENLRGWTATFTTKAGVEIIDASSASWDEVRPETVVLEVLNRLGIEGWQVIAVAEDKGVYAGYAAAEVSQPIRINYLVMRTLQG